MPSYTSVKHKKNMRQKRNDAAAKAYRDLPLVERRRRNKSSKLRSRYGISIEEFDALLTKQNGRCCCCNTDVAGGRGWNVHHSHKTGSVLAILCHLCNRGSGMLGDDPFRLRRLADLNEV
jgi:Recombination endonuclease VII